MTDPDGLPKAMFVYLRLETVFDLGTKACMI
jgi:hypothetical protein